MIDRPILFSAPMVRALLAGTKTQTRRVVKATRGRPIEFLGGGPQGGPDWNNPECWGYEWADGPAFVTLKADPDDPESRQYPCPYGQAGDRLWVREAWKAHTTFDHLPPRDIPQSHVWYMADDGYKAESRLRQGMFMPRWASRITLEITSVRVERLQDISEADALAEGITAVREDPSYFGVEGQFLGLDARESYAALWDSINGPGSCDANPWVWVASFRRLDG